MSGLLVLGLAVKFYKARASHIALKVIPGSLSAGNVDLKEIIKARQAVNINKAGAEDFERLSGIGPGLAGRIIQHRQENGSFLSREDIKKVKGIGDKKYEQIKDYLTVE